MAWGLESLNYARHTDAQTEKRQLKKGRTNKQASRQTNIQTIRTCQHTHTHSHAKTQQAQIPAHTYPHGFVLSQRTTISPWRPGAPRVRVCAPRIRRLTRAPNPPAFRVDRFQKRTCRPKMFCLMAWSLVAIIRSSCMCVFVLLPFFMCFLVSLSLYIYIHTGMYMCV